MMFQCMSSFTSGLLASRKDGKITKANHHVHFVHYGYSYKEHWIFRYALKYENHVDRRMPPWFN